jgi:hypothetical protein
MIHNNNVRRCSQFSIISQIFVVAILCLVGRDMFLSPKIMSSSSVSSCFADAYKVGDTVDAAISTRSVRAIDLLMANMPLFGVSKTVHLPRMPGHFSMSFEEGVHTLPYIDAGTTEKLVVTFVYSKSGVGRIHSVTSSAIQNRKFDPTRDIEVLFDWVEEAAVDFEAGSIVMFLVVLVVSIMFVLQLCTIDHPNEYDDDDDRNSNNKSYYKGR